ncbi:hypothetical protein GYMLUDRAFT_839396 [Collybiopsis luxurians FD-317 M1]|uniref:3-oxoacyl-[acyl-carrier-protein] reductase n=1 Tax=Collybiopsis luxurians FD-317 M1 TaxID=944289 RepID=A0A0D0BLG2_9AGAR|nr:hypothetical protein GYMLUDRAFT_839396 [Collybiopsis luxurians FD-317 M1]
MWRFTWIYYLVRDVTPRWLCDFCSVPNPWLNLLWNIGKVALITGSSKSTGAAIAKALAAQGASVVVNYSKDVKSAEELAHQINAASLHSLFTSLSPSSSEIDPREKSANNHDAQTPGPRIQQQQAVVVKADPSTVAGGQHLLQETLRLFGRLDILVLNAGLMGSKTLSEMDETFFDAHFNVNVKAPLFLVKSAAKVMQKPGGRIIFLSTSLTAASTLLPNALCYVASKGAVEQLSRVLAKDLGTQGFTVNTVAPGPVDTALFREGKPQYIIDGIAAQIPSRRIAEPEDIAPIVAFLASPSAQWINGQIIGVNGGYVV